MSRRFKWLWPLTWDFSRFGCELDATGGPPLALSAVEMKGG
jgi:hypothetical protein